MKKYNLRKKLKSGKTVIGTWNTLGSTMSTKVLASSNLDFQIIDMEHGPFSLSNIHDHVVSSSYFGCETLFRVPTNDPWMSLQALDQGVSGILVPQVEDKMSALKASSSLKYHPLGERGFSPFTLSGEFTNEKVKQYHEDSNSNNILILLLESKKALNNLEEILEIAEVDVIYIGAYDLSKSLNIPGDIFNKRVVDLVQQASKLIEKSNKVAGSFVPQNKDQMKLCVDLGLRFITYSVDTFELKRSYQQAKEDLDSILN